jgi:hypothetical protein
MAKLCTGSVDLLFGQIDQIRPALCVVVDVWYKRINIVAPELKRAAKSSHFVGSEVGKVTVKQIPNKQQTNNTVETVQLYIKQQKGLFCPNELSPSLTQWADGNRSVK